MLQLKICLSRSPFPYRYPNCNLSPDLRSCRLALRNHCRWNLLIHLVPLH
jgi:hypothetical protein